MKRTLEKSFGFTLVELALVIGLIAIVGTLAYGNIDALSSMRQQSELRKFINTWQFLYNEALGKNEVYRLTIDIDKNEYVVLREIPLKQEAVKNVDYLANLRTKSEKKRRREKEAEDIKNLEESFKEEDERLAEPLDTLFYDFLFIDPATSTTVGRLLEYPSLSEPQSLGTNIKFIGAKTEEGEIDSGEVLIRFSPLNGGEFAIVYLNVGEETYSTTMNPATGRVSIEFGKKDYDWKLKKEITD